MYLIVLMSVLTKNFRNERFSTFSLNIFNIPAFGRTSIYTMCNIIPLRSGAGCFTRCHDEQRLLYDFVIMEVFHS